MPQQDYQPINTPIMVPCHLITLILELRKLTAGIVQAQALCLSQSQDRSLALESPSQASPRRRYTELLGNSEDCFQGRDGLKVTLGRVLQKKN